MRFRRAAHGALVPVIECQPGAPPRSNGTDVNIFLLPYTWTRHVAMALWCAAAALVAWWVALGWVVLVGATWSPSWDGPILLGLVAGVVAGASLLGEGNLYRMPMAKRLARTALGVAITIAMTLAWYYAWHEIALSLLVPSSMAQDADDSSLVSLRFRLGAFVMGGLATGLGPMIVRKADGWFAHIVGGLASGFAAAAAWYICNQAFYRDLYLGGAAMALAWGFTFGLLAWGIPDQLYAGWLRVMSGSRYGRRIPIDARDGRARERFIGHFPRGLDLFLPLDEGVLEMHLSVLVTADQKYRARGLTLHPTLVRRFLERVDLRYDPRRPAPLETKLSSGDRVTLGQGAGSVDVEFLMLPREEQ